MDFKERKTVSAAIVGAGLSGLACARSLIDRCDQLFRVELFEAEDRSGGRIASLISGGFQFDQGAQYFTVRSEQFRRQVESWISSGAAAKWNGRIRILKDGSVRDASDGLDRYVGVPSMRAIADYLSAGLNIAFNTRADRIRRVGDQWIVESEKGDALGSFDAVAAALPAPQTARLLSEAQTLSDAAKRVDFAPCWAVSIGFDRRLALDFDGAFVEGSALSWAARNNSKPGRGEAESWLLHALPEWSAAHKDYPADSIVDLLVKEFQKASGKRDADPIFKAARLWPYAIPINPLEEDCLFDDELLIGACGDWCGGPRVEGAYLSGMAIAEKLAAKVAKNF